MANNELTLFAVGASRDYGARVAQHLDLVLGEHEERAFEDGEHKIRPLVEVRRQDVFVIHSLYGDAEQSPNDKLCRLLFFIGALKDAGAERVTAVTPYLCYARKDRRTQPRDPITTKYVAGLFEAMRGGSGHHLRRSQPRGFRECVPLSRDQSRSDPALCRAFRPTAARRTGGRGFTRHRRRQARRAVPPCARAPNCDQEPAAAFVEKRRSGGVVSGDMLVGDVRDRAVVIFDDLISTGGTLQRAARRCREAGATRIFAAATHGLFMGEAPSVFADPVFEEIAVADTVTSVAAAEGRLPEKIRHLDFSRLLAEAIITAHAGR